MFFRGQKGTPVKLEYTIFLESIRPWTSAQAQSDGAAIPLLLTWRRGSKRSGTTNSVMPSVGGSEGGRVEFNEDIQFPATLFERKSGGFMKTSVKFALVEDERAKTVKISRQLAAGELDLSKFVNSTEPCSTRVPMSIGLGGTQAEGDPTLFLRVSSTTSSGRLPQEAPQTSYFLAESDDSDNDEEFEGFTDDDEEPPSSTDSPRARAIEEMKREILFSPNAFSPNKLIYPNPAIARERPSTLPSDGQGSGRTFTDTKVAADTGKEGRESVRLTEEEKKEIRQGLSDPRRSLAYAAKTLETAAASAAKSVAAARISMRDGETDLEAMAALAENYKAAEAQAAAAIEAVQAAATSLGNTAVAATTVAARKASLSMRDECSTSESPPPRTATSPPDSEPQQIEPATPEKKVPEDQPDYKSLLKEAKTKFAMIERRTLEELRAKVAAAAVNEAEFKQSVQHLKEKLTRREDELRDTAAIEVALYSASAEHTSSSHKLHTPARRLARLYVCASPERRASAARNSILGLVVAVRACGNDVPRLTFWWSNIVVLREAIMQACNVESVVGFSGDDSFADRARRSQQLRRRSYWQGSISEILGFKSSSNDWQDCNTYIVALLKAETWIHARILECVWWQAMAPPMQVGGGDTTPTQSRRFMNVRDELNRFGRKMKDGLGELNKLAGDVKEFFTSRQSSEGNLSQLGETNNAIDVWENAFTDALRRLCPRQGHDAECGCLPVLCRQVIAECVDRLDVAIFNGILRNPQDEYSPTDPLADPIVDLSVLPIPAGTLSFGAGSQLKNADTNSKGVAFDFKGAAFHSTMSEVVTWSTWLSALLTMTGESSSGVKPPAEERQQRVSYLKATGELLMQFPKDVMDMAMRKEAARKEAEKASPYFSLLRAIGALLMLPKEMIVDKIVRNEVCPQLKLPLIRRILCNFVPDEFHPEPVSPLLVDAINTEVARERDNLLNEPGMVAIEDINLAPMPMCIYIPPSSTFVRVWIGEPPGTEEWGNTATSLLKKGYESDEELSHFQAPLAWLKESPSPRTSSVSRGMGVITDESMDESAAVIYTARFELLQEVWNHNSYVDLT